MLVSVTAWFARAIMFATVMIFGAVGETLTEKSGQLNLGIPGIMFMGGFSGFAAAYIYETAAGDAYNPVFCVILALGAGFLAASLAGLLYSFITVTLRCNQNVTGLAITIFGVGFGKFFGTVLMGNQTVATAERSFATFSTKIMFLKNIPVVGGMFFSGGILCYASVLLCIAFHFILTKTRVGLNLRAVGENTATSDAAGIAVMKYKYLATCIGSGIAGIGGVYYVLEYNSGMWSTSNGIEALGWLAVALVIFSTWRPLNLIWGSFLFGLLSWAYAYLPNIGVPIPQAAIPLVQMLPYVVTLVVLFFTSFRKRKESQPPENLGLAYFREER